MIYYCWLFTDQNSSSTSFSYTVTLHRSSAVSILRIRTVNHNLQKKINVVVDGSHGADKVINVFAEKLNIIKCWNQDQAKFDSSRRSVVSQSRFNEPNMLPSIVSLLNPQGGSSIH